MVGTRCCRPGLREPPRLVIISAMAMQVKALPVADLAADKSHLYCWTPNSLVADRIPFADGELAFVAASLFLLGIAP